MKNVWSLVLLLFLSFSPPVYGASCPVDDPCESVGNALERVTCYSDVVTVCSSQRESMTAQVTYLTTKIALTTAKIAAAKEKVHELEVSIEAISGKIEKLEDSLTTLSRIFLDRIVAGYKYGAVSSMNVLFTSRNATDFVKRYKYIQVVQTNDRKLLFQLQNSKVNFEDQKKLREDKKQELRDLQVQLEKEETLLAVQKKEKELFLETTKNSEVRYKQELAAAKREAEGIQKAASILSAAGVPKHVNRGDTIGIMGNTGFSTGAHLHFSVYNLKESDLDKFSFGQGYENPFGVLSSREIWYDATSCDDVSSREKKVVGSGSWEWPLAHPTVSQCFGHTPWSWRYQSGVHNGIDMWDDANTLVRATSSGNAYTYRGGSSVGNGVFLFHDNGKMTLYWHLQ